MPQTNTCVTNGNLPPDIYTANLATQLTYNINFDFEAEADVVVYREQPAGTFTLLTNSAATGASPPNYTINQGVSPAQVTFNTNEAPGGVSLIIGRRTDICDPVVTYQVGAAIRAGDLNASNIQLLNLIQELRSTLGFMINGNSTDPIIPGQGMDLGDLDDVNLADPIPNPSLLRWNGTAWVNNNVLESGDAWVANNSTFATTQAGDARWLGGGTTPDVVGGPGVTITPNSPAAGQILVSADLEAAGAGEGGLVFDPNTGNTGEIRVNVGNGLELTANGVEVDLANPSGLEFNGGDLRIDANDGCEIVAAGLNAETTAASIVQTSGTDADPAVRIATTLGTATTNTDLVISGGTGVSVTRNSDTELTIAQTSDNNTTYDLTVPASTTDIRLAGSDGTNDDITITGGTNVTVTRTSATELNIAATDTDNNTTYTLPVTENSGNAILTLTGANPASTDPVTITAGNNVTFGNFSAGGFTINSTGGGSGGSGITIENDGTALATDATTLDFTGAGVTASGTGSTKTINIPGTDTNTTYDLTVPASTTDIRLAGSDGVNDDVTITGGANITVTRTSATELSIAGDVAAANNGQINIAGGDGLTASGDNATANQSGDTTRTLAVGAGTGITVNADDVQLAEIASNRVLGNSTGGNAAPTAVQITQPMINAGSNAADRLLAINSANNGMVWVDPPQGGIAVEDDDTSIVATATTLNFTGAGVTVTDAGSGQADIAITTSNNTILFVTSNPTITGSMLVGQTITCTNPGITGGTPGTGGTFVDGYQRAYQWQSSTTSGGTYTNIAGATNQTYTIAAADTEDFLRCQVVNTDAATPANSVTTTTEPAQVFRGTTNVFRQEPTAGSTSFAQQWSGNGWANPITGTSPTNPGPNPAETYIGLQARLFNCLVENNGTRTYVDSNNCRKAQVGQWLRMQKSTAFDTTQPYLNQNSTNVGDANALSTETFQNNWFDANLAVWASGTAYAVGDMVRQGTGSTNSYWYCTNAHTSTASGANGPPRDAISTDPDVATDGTDGQFMVEIPIFSCEKTWTSTDVTFTLYEGVNTVGNAKVHPLFVRANGTTRDFAYLPKFPNSTAINASSSLTSLPTAVGSLSPGDPYAGNTYNTMATNRGANWQNWSFHCGDALTWLHLGEYGTTSVYVWWGNPYNQGSGLNNSMLALNQIYGNTSFGSCDNAVGTLRMNNYRGIFGSPVVPQIGCWLGNSSNSFYVNTTSVNLGLGGNATDKTEFDLSGWSAGISVAYQNISINTGTMGDDVTIIVPKINSGSLSQTGGFNPSSGMSSLQRSGTGWMSYGTYSTMGSHYLQASGYQLGAQVTYLP